MFEAVLALTQVGSDLALGPAGVAYPWGDSAADEMFVLAAWDLGKRGIAAWREERQHDRDHEITQTVE